MARPHDADAAARRASRPRGHTATRSACSTGSTWFAPGFPFSPPPMIGLTKTGLSSAALVLLSTFPARVQQAAPPPPFALVAMPYSGARNVPELSGGPAYLLGGRPRGPTARRGREALAHADRGACRHADEKEYGEWHRMGLANGHLAELVAANRRAGAITVGLLANCTSVIGMLGGLQHSGAGRRAPVGGAGVHRRPRGLQRPGDDAQRDARRHARGGVGRDGAAAPASRVGSGPRGPDGPHRDGSRTRPRSPGARAARALRRAAPHHRRPPGAPRRRAAGRSSGSHGPRT